MGQWRFKIGPRPGHPDPLGREIAHKLRAFGVESVEVVRSAKIYLMALPDGSAAEERNIADRIAVELLADPVAEEFTCHRQGDTVAEPEGTLALEVHFKPGVMDNVARTTFLALADMGIMAEGVRTARRFEISPVPPADVLPRIRRLLGNDCIEDVFIGTRPIAPPPEPPRYAFKLQHVTLGALDDAALERLSREGHLFLSLSEMQVIQRHFRAQGREPTDLELETLAQTWSEHCVHKTLKSAIRYRGAPMPQIGTEGSGNEGLSGEIVELRYVNLLKDTIVSATERLIAERRGPECLSVFKDNAGIIAFDDQYGAAFKVETHNHPSALEPYGGAATGVGGVIRDVLGCGLGAKPVANTDVFCVAPPTWPIDKVPRGVIHPRTVLAGVMAGVRDYGNCMGIPTVNGAIHFDPRYLGNPLVYCGCVGLIPRDRIEKRARPGDVIVLVGGRTGRDGIHGATFSSAELSDTHEDEFAHAVQIGSPIEEKKVLDFVLRARDYTDPPAEPDALGQKPRAGLPWALAGGGVGGERNGHEGSGGGETPCLFSAITDCGAGGLSSAVGEMACETGAEVDLDRVPLKYAGLRYDEIWISESQERMVLAVPPENLDKLLALAAAEDVEATAIGGFTDTGRLVVRFQGNVVGDLELRFLHDGLPRVERVAEWDARGAEQSPRNDPGALAGILPGASMGAQTASTSTDDVARELLRRLADPIIASKHWLIHQYDHEVQSGSVVKPLVGPGEGPSDAAVIRPRLDSYRALAIGCGLAPDLGDFDPYWMAVAAIDEALRNVVCVGGDPRRTAILDNFCWPRVDHPNHLGALVRACQACHDTALAYGLPFISGKDSLNNEFALDPTDLEMVRSATRTAGRLQGDAADPLRDGRLAIPYTLLISAISIVEDVRRCVTMDLKQNGGLLYLIGMPSPLGDSGPTGRPVFDPRIALHTHLTVARLIHEGLVSAVHDVSDGGLLVAVAEMCIASGRSGAIRFSHEEGTNYGMSLMEFCFSHLSGCYIVEENLARSAGFDQVIADVPCLLIGACADRSSTGEPTLSIIAQGEPKSASIPLSDLRNAWQQPLDW